MGSLEEWFTITENFKKHLRERQRELTIRAYLFNVSYSGNLLEHPSCAVVLTILNHIILRGYEGWVDG